jgi:CDP-2,3-bis-(O-geranylgeranyl)-sn-glycerol synthase
MSFVDLLQAIWFFGPAYAADMSPIFARRLFPRFDLPLDFGLRLREQPLLGSHKTWRGLLAGILAGIAVWEAERALDRLQWLGPIALPEGSGQPVVPGLLMGVGAGLGDALKSFFKRRLGIPPGKSWLVFDQLDFFVGALVLVSPVYAPPLATVAAIVPVVFVCDILATTVFWWFGLKDSWI